MKAFLYALTAPLWLVPLIVVVVLLAFAVRFDAR